MQVEVQAADKHGDLTGAIADWPDQVPLVAGVMVTYQSRGRLWRGIVDRVEVDLRPRPTPPVLHLQLAVERTE